MPIELFPSDTITISQGKAGDCYLLSGLDCILNSGKEGLEHIQSLFPQKDQRDDGSVVVCINRKGLQPGLNLESLGTDEFKSKYSYVDDKENNRDVFIIKKEQ